MIDMKRLLMIIHSYPPAGGSGMFRNFKFSKYLLDNGWQTIVCTIHVKYAEKIDYGLEKQVPDTIEVYRSRKIDLVTFLVRLKEKIRGIFFQIFISTRKEKQKILDSKFDSTSENCGSRKISFSSLIKSFFWFPDKYAGWILPGFILALWRVKKNQIDVLYSSSPPATTHIIGLLLKKITRLPWVVDYRDPWVYDYRDSFSPRLFKKFHRLLETAVLWNADALIFNTDGMEAEYQKKYGHRFDKKMSVIMNGVDTQDFEDFHEAVVVHEGNVPLSIVHTGEFFNPGRLPDSLLQAIGELLLAEKILEGQLQVSFVGGAEYRDWPNYSYFFTKYPLENTVHFTEHVSHKKVIEMLIQADVLLLLQTDSMFANQVPAKIFEYILTGKPILAIITEGEVRNLLKRLIPDQNNLWIAPPSAPEIIRCLQEIVSAKSQGSLSCKKRNQNVVSQISRKELTAKLASLFDEISS